eukprot:COSAG05_NODE_1747_length_4151_cov_4.600197_2_plen_68_part_00
MVLVLAYLWLCDRVWVFLPQIQFLIDLISTFPLNYIMMVVDAVKGNDGSAGSQLRALRLIRLLRLLR